MHAQIETLNSMLLQAIDKSYPVGIAQGQMGISIYFYYLARIERNDEYRTIAERLLDNTLSRLSLDSSLSVEEGLAGIALGVGHLIKAGFIEGNINEFAEDIDHAVFKHLAFQRSPANLGKEELLHWLFYLYVRLTEQEEEGSRYLSRKLIIKTIHVFMAGLPDDFFDEPLSFSAYHYHLPLFAYLCALLLEQNFYNARLYKLWEEWEPKILSHFPRLHANRLYLLCGLLPLLPYMKNPCWKEHALLLQKHIDLRVIFDQEMKNKHIFVSNGLSAIYLLLYYLETHYPAYKISYSCRDFYETIRASDAWESLVKHDYFFNIHSGLLNGFPGVRLVLSHMLKNNLYEN